MPTDLLQWQNARCRWQWTASRCSAGHPSSASPPNHPTLDPSLPFGDIDGCSNVSWWKSQKHKLCRQEERVSYHCQQELPGRLRRRLNSTPGGTAVEKNSIKENLSVALCGTSCATKQVAKNPTSVDRTLNCSITGSRRATEVFKKRKIIKIWWPRCWAHHFKSSC